MNFQIPLFQPLCVVLIASFAYGAPLPTSVTSQYTDCYKLKTFYIDESTPSSESFPHPHIDNLCLDSNTSTYHFLSSAQGGTESFITAPISELTVSFLVRDMLGILRKLPSEPIVGYRCYFSESTHALNVYNSIYQQRTLTRQNLTISRIQDFLLESDTGDRIKANSEFSQHAVVYTESYDDKATILTFKKESANGNVGDPALIIVANMFYISNVFEHKHVVLRSTISSRLYVVLTFRDESEANRFSDSLRGYFDPNTLVTIPPGLQEALEVAMSIFQE